MREGTSRPQKMSQVTYRYENKFYMHLILEEWSLWIQHFGI